MIAAFTGPGLVLWLTWYELPSLADKPANTLLFALIAIGIAAAVAVHKATHCRWIIFGGEGDREIAHVVATGIGQVLAEQPVINLAGQTTLRELAAALKSCRLLLTNDTGPMHLAAAVGTPVVAVFGSTSTEMTGPIFSADAQIVRAPDISCAPCFLRTCPIDFRCMRRIESEVVVKAVLRLASS